MSSFLVSRHRTLPGYVPGTHSEEADVIRLNTNESPYPPSKEVLEAIQEEAARLNYYNDPDCNDLRTALGSRHAVSPEWIMAGNGSDQILQLAFLVFADEQCPIYLPDVTYSLLLSIIFRWFGFRSRRTIRWNPKGTRMCLA